MIKKSQDTRFELFAEKTVTGMSHAACEVEASI